MAEQLGFSFQKIMQESSLGVGSNTTDILQANNSGDWDSFKSEYGLTKSGDMLSVSVSLETGLKILSNKGFRGRVTYDKKTGEKTFSFQGWSRAVFGYNGKGAPEYQENVLRMYNESTAPSSNNY